ncbi:MAG TPA: hypothetical protein GXX14_06240 [Clostridiaceae bacterium]|nr:hypothetical protein [Clostridiaceae bacterium]
MNKRIFIGVDGGGTCTRAIAITADGKVLGKVIGENINFYASGMDVAKANFKSTLKSLMEKCGISDYECISIGMSAVDDDPSDDIVNLFCQDMLPVNKVFMRSDAYMALMGMTLGGPGIIVVSGTGSVGLAVDKYGKSHYIGGWGYLLEDEGSAYYIAIEGIKAALKSFDGLGPTTKLEDELLAYFKISDHRKLIKLLYDPPIEKSFIAGFARVVSQCAEQGDTSSLLILHSTTNILVDYALRLIGIIGDNSCSVAIYGGVFQNNEKLVRDFKKRVNSVFPNVKIGFPPFPAEIGAAFAAMRKNEIEITPDMFSNLKRFLESKK